MAFNLFGISIPQISLPSLPKIEVPKITIPEPPKIEIPKITVPDIPKIVTSPVPVAAVAGAVGEAVAGAVAGAVPKVELPKISLPEPPKIEVPEPPKIEIPEIKLPEIKPPEAKPAWSGAGDVPKRTYTPEEMAGYTIPTGGVSKPGTVSLEPPPGGNIIDVVIGARDRSYEVGIENIAAGNVAGGGAQFAATAGVEIMLPLDLLDAGNLWMTGRGDQIDPELLLWAGIDALSIAAIPFTFGASYAAARALKAGKVAGKTAKIGGEMAKSKTVSGLIGALTGAGKTSKGVTPVSYLKGYQAKTVSTGSDISKRMRDMAEAQKAAQAAALQRIAEVEERITKTVSGLKPLDESVKLPTRLNKIGTGLMGASMGAGISAIGLTALGALGAPAPQEIPEGGDGGGGAGGGLPGGDDYTGAGDDWWSEFIKSLYGGGAYDPSLYEGYDPYAGYYDPGYWDPLGFEPYAQDLLTYAEEIPVVGGVATAAKQSGFALPALIGAVVLVVLVVAFLRSKKGKAMIGGAKKKVSGAVSGAKKAVIG